MSSPNNPKLGRVQLQIMQVLWRRGTATVRQMQSELEQAAPIARSTVQTLLRKMEGRSLVAHTDQDGIFVYRPIVNEMDASTHAANDLLERVFQGSLYDLVAHLLSPERVSADEMRRLRDLIDRKREEAERTSS